MRIQPNLLRMGVIVAILGLGILALLILLPARNPMIL
jgi:hypothetical protein